MSAEQVDLDDYLAEPYEPERDAEGALRMDDDDAPEWALRKMRKAEQQKATTVAPFDAEIARLQRRRAEAANPFDNDIAHYQEILEGFWKATVLAELDEVGDWQHVKKSRPFPAGTLSARKKPDGVEITDLDALVAYAKENDRLEELVKETVTPILDNVKTAVLKRGEILPGVVPVRGEITTAAKAAP